MRRGWLLLIAVGVALGWWALDYVFPRWGWMMDRAGTCLVIGIALALLADRLVGEV